MDGSCFWRFLECWRCSVMGNHGVSVYLGLANRNIYSWKVGIALPCSRQIWCRKSSCFPCEHNYTSVWQTHWKSKHVKGKIWDLESVYCPPHGVCGKHVCFSWKMRLWMPWPPSCQKRKCLKKRGGGVHFMFECICLHARTHYLLCPLKHTARHFPISYLWKCQTKLTADTQRSHAPASPGCHWFSVALCVGGEHIGAWAPTEKAEHSLIEI